jgi:hypothetical protein
MEFEANDAQDVRRVCEFTAEVAETFDADYAVAHVLTRFELEDRLAAILSRPPQWPQPPGEETVRRLRALISRQGYAAVLGAMRDGDHTVKLRKCIKDVSWFTVFGRPYIEMIGEEKLLRTPAHDVRPLSNGAIAIRLTERLDNTEESWPIFRDAALRCKAHIGHEVYCEDDAAAESERLVPLFRLPWQSSHNRAEYADE